VIGDTVTGAVPLHSGNMRAIMRVTGWNLWIAKQAYPNQPRRIITSGKHSTVWDGEDTIFDTNFLAMGVPVEKCWELAAMQDDSIIFEPGELYYFD